MKNKHERMKEAQAFGKEKCAYLHIEYRDGRHDGTVMAGDPVAIMTGILCALRRLSELSGMSVEEHIGILGTMWAESCAKGEKMS